MQFTNAAAEVDPLQLYYTHSKIRNHFSKGGKRIVDTISDIEQGLMSVDDFPPITVVIGTGGHLFCLDNRRLYVLKHLRRKGLLPNNSVTVLMRKAPPRDVIKYNIDKYSLNCTIMREKEQNDYDESEKSCPSPDTSTTVEDNSLTTVEIVREKNDKKKNKVTGEGESDQERYLRQKRIIAEKQEEFKRQALERQRQKQLEKEALQKRATAGSDMCDDRGEMSDVSSDECSDDDNDDDESMEDVYVCDICRKEFKSEQQIEQHLGTKAHKKKVKDSKKKKGGEQESIKLVTRPKKKKSQVKNTKPIVKAEENLIQEDLKDEKHEDEDDDEEVGGLSTEPVADARPGPLTQVKRGPDLEKEELEEEEQERGSEGSDGDEISLTPDSDGDGECKEAAPQAQVVTRKSDPVEDALMLLLIQRRISQLEAEKNNQPSEEDTELGESSDVMSTQQKREEMRMTAGSMEASRMIAQLEQQERDARYNQQLTKSFQHEGVGSKALPSQYVHKQGAAFDARMAENRHHRGSHYVMAGGVQFQRGVRVKGVVSRHSKQAAIRNGPVGGGAQNMKRMGLLNEQRETAKKGGSSGGKKSKKKSKKNPSD